MTTLGVDPGKRTGLVILDAGRLRERVDVDADGLHLAVRRLCAVWWPDVLAIELPSQVFAFGRGKVNMGVRIGIERALLVARGIAGEVKGIVRTFHPGVRVFEDQAHNVRKAVLGRIPRAPKGTDARTWLDGIIRARVPLLVADWTKGAGDNDHNRDAAIAALWGERVSKLPAALRSKRKAA